jgi:hypothetical protein
MMKLMMERMGVWQWVWELKEEKREVGGERFK